MTGVMESPRDVLLLDSDALIQSDLEASLPDEITLTTIQTIDSIESRVAESNVGCVVAPAAQLNRLPDDFATRIHAHAPDLPIVLVAADPDAVPPASRTAHQATHFIRSQSPEEIAATVQDALSRYETRRDHRRHSMILRSMFDQFPYSMYVKDEQARFRMATDVMPDSETIHGKTDLDWFGEWDPESAQRTYQEDCEVIETGEPVIKRQEAYEPRTGEGPAWAETTKVPWYDKEGNVMGLVGTSIDITERKQLEQELERNQALHQRIARYVAHDIRNPLNLARGQLELARESLTPDRFNTLEDALDRIEDIVTDMQIITGNDAEPPGPTNPPIPLRPVIMDAWETIDAEDASLTVDVPEQVQIHADHTPLQEICENLFRNAIEHGGPDVAVRVEALTDGFLIADDGPGFPDDPDTVLQYGVSTDEDGSGLGLAIVQEIADTYGWTVTAGESDAGGAQITITDALLISHSVSDESAGKTQVPLESHRDIGDPTPSGSATMLPDTDGWRVTGGGRDIYHQTNEHHFVYTDIDGDARISGRLTELERAHDYSKAGLMIRSGLEESAPFGFIGMTADHGAELLWRSDRDGPTNNIPYDTTASLPQWYRLDVRDKGVTAFVSHDGSTWIPIDQRHLELDTVYAGLAVCSHTTNRTVDARFDTVTAEALSR